MDRFKQQEINHEQRQAAADRLMIHLLQKGDRPAPYKERLIGVLANPDKGRMPETLSPITNKSPLGIVQQLVFAIESWIRSDERNERQQLPSRSHQSKY